MTLQRVTTKPMVEWIGCKEVTPGIWGMIGGDADCDGDINEMDMNLIWKPMQEKPDIALATLTSTDRWITRIRMTAGNLILAMDARCQNDFIIHCKF